MLKTNRLNCPLAEGISSSANDDIGLRTVLQMQSEAHKAEQAVQKFSGNCVRPSTAVELTADDSEDEQ
ncbi:MAG: hypothetical protein LUG26_09645 [Ruminococcus sp.]|nr:hypothetical protein [Ruminococcus sp.]